MKILPMFSVTEPRETEVYFKRMNEISEFWVIANRCRGLQSPFAYGDGYERIGRTKKGRSMKVYLAADETRYTAPRSCYEQFES